MKEEDGFWSEPTQADQDRAAEKLASERATDFARTRNIASAVLQGLATGGLMGMLVSVDEEEDSSEPDVEDPEALRKAEEAVSHWETPFDERRTPSNEDWTAVARQRASGDNAGLEDVLRALESEGIDCGWDPYDPRDTVNFGPPKGGFTASPLFAVVVPVSQIDRARTCLCGAPPLGVDYTWESADTAIAEAARRSMPPERDERDALMGPSEDRLASHAEAPRYAEAPDLATGAPTPVTGYSPTLSDNDHLEHLVSGGGASRSFVLAAIALCAVAGIVAYVVLARG
jgi:hypothetical protein